MDFLCGCGTVGVHGHWAEEEEEAGNGNRGSRVPSWKLDPP